MRNVPALTWRELNGYFFSPLAYIILTVFLALSGLVFYLTLLQYESADLRGWMYTAFFILVLTAPMITMRLLAEEARSGSIEMLMTVAVTETEVVLSKFLGALLFYLFMLLVPSIVYVIILAFLGEPELGHLIAGYFGLTLAGALVLSVGLFCSSITRHQIVAAISGLVAVFFLWLIAFGGDAAGGGAGRVLDYMGIISHMQGFVKGIVDLRDVGYFVTGTALFLFMSVKVLESRRWR